jgi:hypothetical protein
MDDAHVRAVFHRNMREQPFESNRREKNEYKLERASDNPGGLSAGER